MLSSNNGTTTKPKHSLTDAEYLNLWRQFQAHLIGLATVIWVMVFREKPPKC